MTEQINELERLEARCREEIASLEQKLSEAKKRLESVLEVISLLEKEGGLIQQPLLIEKISSKYEKTKMGDAIIDIIKSAGGKRVTAGYILKSLISNGFTSNTKNLKRDLYTRLHRFERAGKLSARKEGKFKKYCLREQRTEEFKSDMGNQ